MDKNELIARINSARQASKDGARKNAERILRTLAADLKVEEVFTTLSVDVDLSGLLKNAVPLREGQTAGMSSARVEEENQAAEVDHFAEWVEGTDLRYGECRDFSVENPGLHALYTNWAHHHLIVINKAIRRLGRFSNLNLSDSIVALNKCRRELIASNTAYRDAAARIVAGIAPEPYIEEDHGTGYAAEAFLNSADELAAIKDLLDHRDPSTMEDLSQLIGKIIKKIDEAKR